MQLENQKDSHFNEFNEKENYCNICKKTFSTFGNLKNHIITIHEHKRPFICPFPNCDKKYSIESRLKAHYKIHTNSKQFTCRICGKAFNEKGNLKTHEKFHSDKRPFKCNFCNKNYKTNGHLKDHFEIQHLKIKRFTCNFCNKKFGRISTLKAHNRTHTGEKNYKCKIEGCDKVFAEKGNMEVHFKRHLMKIQKNNLNYKLISDNNQDDNNNITRPNSKITLINNLDYNINNNDNLDFFIKPNFLSHDFNYEECNFLISEQKNNLLDFTINNNNNNIDNKSINNDLPDNDDLTYLNYLPELNENIEKSFINY